MNTKLMTACFFAGALIAPMAGYAADTMSKDKPSVTEKAKESVGDAVITTKIKADFAKDKDVSALNIKVDTDAKGVVTLSGNAKSKAEADKAVKIANDTKGVTAVKNDIVIGTMMQSAKENVGDAVITTKIKADFAKDKQVSALNIKVDTDDKGVVTLSGNAKSKAEADKALKIARDTKGVTSVNNYILVGDTGGKTSMTESVKENVGDAVITTKIKAEYAKDKQVSALNIKVDTDDKGVVQLTGTAKTQAEADKAVKIARDTKGVTSVKNDIKVQTK